MTFIANTTATFYRGEVETVDGDKMPANEPYATGVPVAITTRTRTVMMPNTGEPGTFTAYIGRVNATFDVSAGNRIKDERTGQFYTIADVVHGQSLAQQTSCIMDLRV